VYGGAGRGLCSRSLASGAKGDRGADGERASPRAGGARGSRGGGWRTRERPRVVCSRFCGCAACVAWWTAGGPAHGGRRRASRFLLGAFRQLAAQRMEVVRQ
jgi:hypothetical protein